MGRVCFAIVAFGSLFGLGLTPQSSRALLYSPDEPNAIPVGADGKPQSLPFDEFRRRILELRNVRTPTLKTPERQRFLDRIERHTHARHRSQLETIALAVDLLRVGDLAKSETLLTRERQGFLPNVILAHVYGMKGEWAKAYDYLEIANGERPPTELRGLSPGQLSWQISLDNTVLTKLFQARWHESRHGRATPENEDLDAIFPVRFVDAKNEYEPGNLAPNERAKLPPDALATVQQLMLWFPDDTRLYWLLGELYAANGQLEEAQKIMDECVSEARQYGNRKILRAHRELVRAAAEAKRKIAPLQQDVPLLQPATNAPTDSQPTPASPISMKTVGIYFGVVGLVVVFALGRGILRRGKKPQEG